MTQVQKYCVDCDKAISSEATRCRACALKARSTKIQVPCDHCGTILTRKPSQIQRSEYNFCNIHCRSAWRSENLRGDRMWTWKGGPMSSKCAECGTIFERNKASNQKYCSVECKGKAQSKWQTKEKKPNVECANCGKSIYKTNYELNKHQYSFCGNDCYGQWLAEHRAGENHPRYREENYTELECAYCGQTITRAIHATRGKEKHFCDGDCMHKWQSENWQGENHHNWVERVEVSCAYCGQTVEKLECQIKNWEKSFCRRECMSKWQAEHWIGETAPAWKGGKSFEPYTSEFNGQLKRAIRKRDGYCCQLCGVRQKKKSHDVHHIDYDKTNNDPQNLITLCHRCHGFTNGNREYWQALLTEFLVQKLVCQKAA